MVPMASLEHTDGAAHGHGGDADGRRDAKVVRVADEDSHDAMGGNHVDGLRADAYGEDRTDRRDQSEVDGDPKERLVP